MENDTPLNPLLNSLEETVDEKSNYSNNDTVASYNPFVPPYIQVLRKDMTRSISNNTSIGILPSELTSLIFEFLDLKSITLFCEKYLDLKTVIKKHLYYLNAKEGALDEQAKEFLYPFKTIELYTPGHEGEFDEETQSHPEVISHPYVRIMVWAEKEFDIKYMHSTYFNVMFRTLGLVSSITTIKLGEGKMLFDMVVRNNNNESCNKLLEPNNFILDIRKELLRSNGVPFKVTNLRIWSLFHDKEYKRMENDCSVYCYPNTCNNDSEDESWEGNLSNLGHYFETFSLFRNNSSLFKRMIETTRLRPTLSQLSSNSERIEEIENKVSNFLSEMADVKNELVSAILAKVSEITAMADFKKVSSEITAKMEDFKNELMSQAGNMTQNQMVRIVARGAQGPFKCVSISFDASNEQVLEAVRTKLGLNDIVAMCDDDRLALYECGEDFENGKKYYALSKQEYDEFLMKYQ